MINGAVEIIGGVQGQHLHPLLLAQSQGSDAAGFIMVAYSQQFSSCGNDFIKRFYDLFFFRGTAIVECARINHNLRFVVQCGEALRTFESLRAHPATRVHLYEAEDRSLEVLRSTCCFEPCLKLQMKALTEDQVRAQLLLSRCKNGIIECNELEQERPRIHLAEIGSEKELSDYVAPFNSGRLLLYDIDENREVLRHRAPLIQACGESALGAGGAAPEPEGEERAHKKSGQAQRALRNPAEASELVRAVDRLFRLFRQKLYDVFGEKSEALLCHAEKEVRFLAPEFDACRLTDDTALLVFELVEKIIGEAPFLRRPTLRRAGAQLFADLYAKHHELLDRYHAADAVEQAYYRLKQ